MNRCTFCFCSNIEYFSTAQLYTFVTLSLNSQWWETSLPVRLPFAHTHYWRPWSDLAARLRRNISFVWGYAEPHDKDWYVVGPSILGPRTDCDALLVDFPIISTVNGSGSLQTNVFSTYVCWRNSFVKGWLQTLPACKHNSSNSINSDASSSLSSSRLRRALPQISSRKGLLLLYFEIFGNFGYLLTLATFSGCLKRSLRAQIS